MPKDLVKILSTISIMTNASLEHYDKTQLDKMEEWNNKWMPFFESEEWAKYKKLPPVVLYSKMYFFSSFEEEERFVKNYKKKYD